MSIELPPKPLALPAETFDARMLNWWRECDILLREACHNKQSQWMDSVVPTFAPTLDRIADAWDAMEVRLGELAAALAGQPAGNDGARVAMTALLSESTDRPPGEVATAVLARVAAVDSMLGGEPA